MDAVNLYICYKIDWWSRDLDTDFALGNCLFESLKLTKNADPDEHKYSGYGIGFDSRSEFSLPDESYGKNVIIFGVYMSSTVHVDNKRKVILILGKGSTQGLDNTKLTAEAKYLIKFTKSNERFVLSLNCNINDSFLFVNTAKVFQFKAKDSEIKKHDLCLGNVSIDFTIDNMKKKKKRRVLKGGVNFFSVD